MARHRPLLLLLALGFAVGSTGCRKPRKRAHTKQQLRQIEASTLDEAPTPQIPIDAVLDDKIRLIGVDLDKTEVKPGQTFEVTWYWESLKAAPGGWKVFVHLEAPGKRSTHDHHPVGELYPIAKWREGEIIKDVQRIQVPGDFPKGTATVYAGIFEEEAWRERKQNVRMKVVNKEATKVPTQADGRIKVASVSLGKAAPKPRYTAYKLGAPIVLDGKLDDEAWSRIPTTSAFKTPGGGATKPSERTTAKLAWDDQFLYAGFTCPDSDIYNAHKGRDATLWKEDVVELYLDPGRDGRDYVELQVSPTGEIFDAVFASHRSPKWEDAAHKLTLDGMVARVDADGSVNRRGDGVTDKRWTAELRIPWAELPGVSAAPAGGTWAMNLYRIGVHGERFMAAWTPVGGDFHNVSAFGTVTFSKAVRGARRARPPAPAAPKVDDPAAPKVAPAGGESPQAAPGAPAPAGGKE